MNNILLTALLVLVGLPFWAHAANTAIIKPPNNLGLVGYWPMNEATSTQAGDFSGFGNTGTLTGAGGLPAWTSGKLGQAVFFDGSDDYVSVGNAGSSIKTVSFWMKADTAASKKVINIDGTIQVELNGSSQVTATSFPAATVYVDGIAGSAVDTGWHFVTVTDSTGVGASTFEVGRVAGSYFPGKIDDIRLYSRALTAAEVLALYKQGAARVIASTKTLQQGSSLTNGLAALWTFDGGDTRWTSETAGVTYDGSGNNNIGTLTNMSRTGSIVIGKLGQAFTFDGSTQYINAGTGSSLNLTSTGSLAAWVKYSASCGSFAEIFGQYNNTTDTNGYEIACYPTNGLSLVIANATTPNIVSSAGAYNDGVWHHVAGTWDGSNLRLYVDGALIAGPSAQTVNAVSNVNNFNIARDSANDNAYFPGTIDDVRVYNRALSALEVKQLYLLGRTLVKP